MFRFAYANQNTAVNASAHCAEAASSCASHAAASCADMSIIMMDAILMASILLILRALIGGIIGIRLFILVFSLILPAVKLTPAHTE